MSMGLEEKILRNTFKSLHLFLDFNLISQQVIEMSRVKFDLFSKSGLPQLVKNFKVLYKSC